MAKYDPNDYMSVAIMEGLFGGISREQWEEYIELAEEKNLGFKEVQILKKASRFAGNYKRLSNKELAWVLNLAEQLDVMQDEEEKNEKTGTLIESHRYKISPSNVTFRVAWHDNCWNGTICKDPEKNTYCSGYNSLLSERIRKRKEKNIAQELANKGKPLGEIDYLPPCFWSINLFGKDELSIVHDNPAAPDLDEIQDSLPPNSILSWPFSVSFTRTKKEQNESGAYPKNLESVRIPRFNAKIHENQSIAFFYAKFSNPLTEEEQKYLVVGAGIVDRKDQVEEIPHFGPPSEIERIKERDIRNFKYRNFPSINWAMGFSFSPYSTVRMPNHEYLEESERLDEQDRDKFLDKIKVAITEPELEWCFKYVAMDIGDDEAIYILTKMRKALIDCRDDGIVPREDMIRRIQKVDELLKMAWSSRSYFPGFVNVSRVLLSMENEPDFPLEAFYDDFKFDAQDADKELKSIIESPQRHKLNTKHADLIHEIKNRLEQYGLTIEHFLKLCMLNLKPFQFSRVISGKLRLSGEWIKQFDDDVKRSHKTLDIINNPYLLFEDYEYWPNSHDDVYGEELDAPIDLFKIDIAYFPHTLFQSRIDLQREMSFIDKRRIRALIIRHLNSLEQTGDCFAEADNIQQAMAAYPLYYELDRKYELPENFFHPISQECALHFQDGDNKLKIVEANENTYYYLLKLYNAEKNIEAKFFELIQQEENKEVFPELSQYIDNAVSILAGKIGNTFEETLFREEREKLYINVFAKRLFVISGSAGSGKSYEVLNIVDHLENEEGQECLILAPTGKAALRLASEKDFPGLKAYTIDKFIADVFNNKIPKNKLRNFQNVIIDETSMVDLLKLEKLLNLFHFEDPAFKRLILIGDPNQLPAIGYGRVLADLISFFRTHKNYQNHFIQLETNCRSELRDNKVLDLAEAFKLKGELDLELDSKFKRKVVDISPGFRTRYWNTKEELYEQIKEEFERLCLEEGIEGNNLEKLNQILGLKANGDIKKSEFNIENFQILTPYHGQFSGASKINDFIQLEFKKELDFELRKNLYKKSDKLIRTKNYYQDKELLLSNGTLGFVWGSKYYEKFYYEQQGGVSKIHFFEIRKPDDEFFELAYAITVHKSQGSGFNHLFVVLPLRYGLLSKELVYTALTRSKKSITIFLQDDKEKPKSVLDIALGRSYSASRKTSFMLDKPFRYYDLEPEPGIFVESRVELLIYHILMQKRKKLGDEVFDFAYEEKPFVNGHLVNIKTDFTIYSKDKIWYWEHLGLLGQRKYQWTWQNIKKPTYQEAGIWDQVITTDELQGISPDKIETIVNAIVEGNISTEDKWKKFSEHHFSLR